jgi:hypothetical protein
MIRGSTISTIFARILIRLASTYKNRIFSEKLDWKISLAEPMIRVLVHHT